MNDAQYILFLFIFKSLSCNAFVQQSQSQSLPFIVCTQKDSTVQITPSPIGLPCRVCCLSSCLLSSKDSTNNDTTRDSEESTAVHKVVGENEQQQQQYEGTTSNQDKVSQSSMTEQKEREEEEQQQDPQVETSLAKVLEKARARRMVLLPYRIQAFFNNPVLTLSKPLPAIFTIGDVSFVLVAIWLDSYGFALGYSIGKLTTRSVRGNSNMPVALTELWTVGLAVGLDIVWRNVG